MRAGDEAAELLPRGSSRAVEKALREVVRWLAAFSTPDVNIHHLTYSVAWGCLCETGAV